MIRIVSNEVGMSVVTWDFGPAAISPATTTQSSA
jgi:hypothetical protein